MIGTDRDLSPSSGVMDGVHDLGGKQGFGPVNRTHEDDAFHTDADARAYALTVSLRAERAYPIDWFRHVRELIDPVDYLTRPYFDQWLQTALAMAVDAGDVSLAELETGAQGRSREPVPMSVADVRTMLTTPAIFERDTNVAPAFAEGDAVRTLAQGHSGHFRLPAYARGAKGKIHAHRGAHPLPDKGAQGEEVPEHLYTVAFAASDVFPDGNPRDTLHLDLWESYLERA